MRIRIKTGNYPPSQQIIFFDEMPTQSELESSLTYDSTNNIYRTYILPDDDLEITGKITIPPGINLMGQGASYRDNNTNGTRLLLDETGQIELSTDSGLDNLKIIQDTDASVDAITNTDEAFGFTLQNIKYYGGNHNIWAIRFKDHYEAQVNNIYLVCDGNGVYYDFTGPYNTGDQSVNDLRIRLQSAETTGLLIDGSLTDTKKWNNIKFNNFYCSGGDNPSWETDDCIGVSLQNCARISFDKINIEELVTAIRLEGQIESGGPIYAITFRDGWIYKNIIAVGGLAEGVTPTLENPNGSKGVLFDNVMMTSTVISGDDASKIELQ